MMLRKKRMRIVLSLKSEKEIKRIKLMIALIIYAKDMGRICVSSKEGEGPGESTDKEKANEKMTIANTS